MLQTINQTLDALVVERGLDTRGLYRHVATLPPDGAEVEVEVSDAPLADALRQRLAAAGADAARVRVVALPRPGVAAVMIAISSVADVRRAPSHASELVSQVVYGDAVTPLKMEGDWVLCRLDDGYVGWIRNWHLAERAPQQVAAFLVRARHRVLANQTEARATPDAGGLPVSDLVAGVPVAVAAGGQRGWVAVELADGKTGYVAEGDLEPLPAGGPIDRQGLVSTGLRYLGIPYLWGGNTPKGFDCSGLVQRIYRQQGRILPRDSDQQALVGQELSTRDPGLYRPGDLVFFGRSGARITHVGLVLEGARFLHAYGQVRVNSLDPAHPEYHAGLAEIWRSARNILT